MDWKSSSRASKKMVRVYTEETDRPAVIVCDQREPLFFGSQKYTKSVVAAQVATFMAWLMLDKGDRVGGIILSETAPFVLKPKRSTKNVIHYT
ncbi:DUF58 domain-containing protein [Vibrio sp. SS-MA-C1-2]|uniref:DUF58 domain-containing protein n=1 Tax=Vibrio sp. SS-MA-C1-2 TaxID=2908646 RepID=UPI001F314C85|nr:DUF58 domain-containing protein [Vibrio sp. SS-MA-C1-2]